MVAEAYAPVGLLSSSGPPPAYSNKNRGGGQADQQRYRKHHGQCASGRQGGSLGYVDPNQWTGAEVFVAIDRVAERHDDDVRGKESGVDGLDLPAELPAFARLERELLAAIGRPVLGVDVD